MELFKNALQFLAYLFPTAICVSFFAFTMYWCTIREQIGTAKLKRLVEHEAVAGNQVAIDILKAGYRCRIEFSNKYLIEQALKGNQHAIEVLQLKQKY